MEKIKIKDLLNASNGYLLCGDKEKDIKEVVIDSRKVNENTLFVAIKGENFDGHSFVKECYDKGCRMFVLSNDKVDDSIKKDSTICIVKNTELFMGDLASYYKNKHKIPYIAVTGSVGKTTTRDMVYSGLTGKYNTLKNVGNLNNHLGVPLTLFNLEEKHECAVLEMGMSHFGEIEYLSDMVKPDIAVISNIGLSHVENLGSKEGILKAKLEITKNFNENNLLIVNGDDELLSTLKDRDLPYRLKTFGFKKNNDFYCKEYTLSTEGISFVCEINGKEETFSINALGEHNVLNLMSAVLVGLELGLTPDEIRRGFDNYKPTSMRLDIIENDYVTVINDCYNASTDSMKSSLKVLSSFGNKRKVAILGDMFEMGDMSEFAHRVVGKHCVGNADVLITVGNDAKYILDEADTLGFKKSNQYYFNNKSYLKSSLETIIKKDDIILVKASRGMKLEEIVDFILNIKFDN